jgi:hypothetical protein
MKPERKSEIRSMHRLVKNLVKASLIKQAKELEAVIASTFEFSKDFMALLKNTPATYIEKIYEVYTSLMMKAFDAGVATATIKSKEAEKLPEAEDLDIEIKTVMPISYGLSQDLLSSFRNSVNEFIKTLPDLDEVYAQFQKDLEEAHVEGVKNYLENMPKEGKESEKSEEKKIEEMKQETAPEVVEPEKVAAATEPTANLSDLEKYTKLLGPGVAEQVLRATLGLPPLSPVTASVIADVDEDDMIGPYNAGALRDKVVELVKSSQVRDSDLQSVIVDCLVSSAADMDGDDLAESLSNRLGISAKTFTEVQSKLDELSLNLKDKVALPGDFVFLTHNGDYCLVFAYSKEDAENLLDEPEDVVIAAAKPKKVGKLPRSPQGALEVDVMKEIEALAKLAKGSTYKDVKKASPKTASYMSSILSNIRNSKVGLAEGGGMLKASLPLMVENVFGTDGLDYFNHLKAGK